MNGPRSVQRLRYASHRYDDDLLLKVPPVLWLALIFLMRHILLLGITFLPTTGEEIEIFRDLIRPEFVLTDLVAAPVLLAGFRRRRPCADWLRRIWRASRQILTLSILIYWILAARATLVSGQPFPEAISEPLLASLLLSLAILVYLWRSPLVADLVRDCPGRVDL